MAKIHVIKTVSLVIQPIQVKVFEEFLSAMPLIGVNSLRQLGYSKLGDISLKHYDAVRIVWGGTQHNSVLVEAHSEKNLDISKGIVFANRYTHVMNWKKYSNSCWHEDHRGIRESKCQDNLNSVFTLRS